MKVLVVSDSHMYNDILADITKRWKNKVDLLVHCGDSSLLPDDDLLKDFDIVVHGNHDDKYERIPPDGCICIDDKIYVHEGVRILGLGGSMRYKPGEHQYTEWEMRRRVFKLFPKLVCLHVHSYLVLPVHLL